MDIFNVIQTRLIYEEKMPVAYAAVMAAQALFGFQPELQQAVRQWAEGQSIANATLGEYTVADIQEEIGCSEFQALCMLNMTAQYPGCFDDAVLFLPQDRVEVSTADLLKQDGQDEATEIKDDSDGLDEDE